MVAAYTVDDFGNGAVVLPGHRRGSESGTFSASRSLSVHVRASRCRSCLVVRRRCALVRVQHPNRHVLRLSLRIMIVLPAKTSLVLAPYGERPRPLIYSHGEG